MFTIFTDWFLGKIWQIQKKIFQNLNVFSVLHEANILREKF